MALKPKITDPTATAAPISDPALVPFQGLIDGETIVQWTEDWWRWTLQAPAAANPLLDTDGSFAGVNNTGTMFFLGGAIGTPLTDPPQVIAREFNAPASKMMLVPILNFIALQFTGTGPNPKNIATGTPAAANELIKDWANSVTNLFLRIDGKDVIDFKQDFVKTGFFSAGTATPDSLAGALGLTGDLGHSKSEGFWAVLPGFAAGTRQSASSGALRQA